MERSKTHPVGAVILALIIAILIQIPFAVLSVVPHLGFGVPGIGTLFFAPGLVLTKLLSRTGTVSIVGTIAVQMILTFIPIFWVVTWKRRPALQTLARVFAFLAVLIAATAIAIPLERRREARIEGSQINGKSPVLSSIQRLDSSLAFYKKRYGQYPDSLSQLDFPPDQDDVDSRHAGIIQFPLPMQDFFDFSYERQESGYVLRIDGKPGQGWQLYHYCADDSATIRFETNRNKCQQGTIVYSKPH